MEAQGYTIDSNILLQNNQSTILIAKNSRSSAGKKSKHVNNRYFTITDKIHQEDLEIRYKSKGEMLDYCQSNTQQGKLFHTIRSNLMNCPVDFNDDEECRNTPPPTAAYD